MENQTKKETILFVHGAWHGKWCWDKYFRLFFEEKGFRVVTFDLPGHSSSGKVTGINKFSVKNYVDALKNEVAKLEKEPIIVAHSMGGLILQKYLETEVCKKAVLLAPVPVSGVLRTTLNFAKHGYFYPSLLTFNLYGLVNALEKSKRAFFSNSLAEKELMEYTSLLCSESFKAFIGMLFPNIKSNKVKTEMLVMAAENDTIFTIKENQKTAKFHDADFLLLENSAHDIMLDIQKEKAAQEILSWIKK